MTVGRPSFACLVVALASAAVPISGCRTNLLPEYHCKIRSAGTLVDPVPWTGGQNGRRGLVRVAGSSVADDAEMKLHTAMPPERVQEIVGNVVDREAPSLGFNMVPDESKADTRLEITVLNYGIDAGRAIYRLEMYGALTFKPERKLIWEYRQTIERRLTDGSVLSALSPAWSLEKISTDDTRLLVSAATEMVTHDFIHMLASEYAEARGKNQCH